MKPRERPASWKTCAWVAGILAACPLAAEENELLPSPPPPVGVTTQTAGGLHVTRAVFPGARSISLSSRTRIAPLGWRSS